jgi:hypothetical protein
VSALIPPRKYISEGAISLSSAHAAMLPPDQLHVDAQTTPEQEAILKDCHIYLICRRPALSIDPDSFSMNGDVAQGHLTYRLNGKMKSIAFKFSPDLRGGSRIVVDAYPHKRLLFVQSDGDWSRYLPAAFLPGIANLENHAIRAFEVAYVGQAYGDGTRSAIDRLRNHSMLQRILAETSSKTPDQEVMLFLFSYAPSKLISSFDSVSKAQIQGESDKEHWISMRSNPPTEQMEVALAEAGLIRYFEPEYNEKFKQSFPHEGLKLLQQCYRLDFAGLIVEIDTEDLKAPIYSARVQKGVHHIALFDLHDANKRRTFFSILDRSGRLALMNEMSGPVY